MEDDNNRPSLPSNYVTLAQLQERWLKQKEKEKQLQENRQQEQQEEQELQQQIPELPQHSPREYHQGRRPKAQQQAWRAIPARPTRFGHAAMKRPPAESGPKNPNVPESNRVAVEVSHETNESVEARADIGDGNVGQDGKKNSKKKRKSGKRKPRADKEEEKLAEDATESTMVGNKEVANSDVQRTDEKTKTKIELNDSKSNALMREAEQKLGTISMNSENEKQISRVKTYDSSRGSQRNNGGRNHRIGPRGRADKEKKKLAEDATQSTMVENKEEANSDVQRVDDKRETNIELNVSKSSNLMIEVEQKLGTISMNSENEKQNSRVKTYDSSRGSQRNNGGHNYRIGPYGGRSSNSGPYGSRIRAHEVQRRRFDQKIWVRKCEDSNGNVGHNEISSK